MSTIPRRNHVKTDSRDREATRTMGASRDFTTGIDTGAPTALRERPSPKRAPSRTRIPHRSTKRLGSKQVVSFRGRQLQPQTKKSGLFTRLSVIAITLLIAGVVMAMWLSGLSTKQTFAIQQLTVQDSQLDNQIETLNRDAENLSSSADIARRADEMGMAVPKQPGIAEVGGDGKIVEKREGTPDTEKLIDVNGEPIRPGQASSDPKDTEGMSDSLNAVPQGQQRTARGGSSDTEDRNKDRDAGNTGAESGNARPNLPARAPYASRAE
ncbi:hypothetical protein L8V01_02265 [Corynebacterium sp. c8Ua_181]|uniref:Cell division protein FtsL n=1 Tax=Corynebacterium curieae TaxID=2913500 RepID=A0A9X3M8S1_9CORY|nr:hypothetical protein [Corynebacterium curieae]MCZ9306312.1 hypothetical protein [Corynebacterium curieae]MDV2423077.1 hypothetical protein [Corynebacterium curieae]